MSGWGMLGLLSAALVWLALRAVWRRYQNFRIRQHQHAAAWRDYVQWKRNRVRRW